MYGYTSVFFFHFTKGNNFHDILFACLADIALPSKLGLTPKKKNLLQEEELILSFESKRENPS